MNRIIIGVIIAVVIVGGVAVYVMTRGSGQEAVNPQPLGESGGQPVADQRSIKELIAAGVAQKCEVSDNTDAAKTQGTVYVGGGKMRGDFRAVADGKTMQAHMISEGQDSYTWIDGMTTGFKATAAAGQTSGASEQKGIDAEKKLNYRCSPWSVDTSLFTLPTNVTFSSFGSAGTGADGKVPPVANPYDTSGQCATCDSLPADAKAQCRTALGCK